MTSCTNPLRTNPTKHDANPSFLPIRFLPHIERRALFCEVLLEHLQNKSIFVGVLDGIAPFLEVEIQAAPIDARYSFYSSGVAAEESDHSEWFFGGAVMAVKPARIAGRGADDAARL